MAVPMTASRSFMASIEGLPTLEWNVELTATCPKCRSVAHVHAREGGTAVICLQCKWSVQCSLDSLSTMTGVLRQAPD
jgi:transcription elongation factor Elf1